MKRLLVTLTLVLAVLAFTAPSDASIYVKISDGTTLLDGLVSTTRNQLNLGKLSPAPPPGTTDVTDSLFLLRCSLPPCTVFFPSGQLTQQLGDTFKISDVSSTNRARVDKFDSGASADLVSMKGIKIVSLTTGKTLTVTYGTQATDLRSLTTTQSSNYIGTAVLSGFFKTSGGTGLTRATACTAGLTSTDVSNPCVKLSLAINALTVDGAGATNIATVAVACSNSFPTVNPCGTNGSWTSTGTFTGVNDTKTVNCPSTCIPVHTGTLTAKFNGANEGLQLTASAVGGMGNVSEEVGGAEEVALSIADELGSNRWVAYTALNERCHAVPKAPTTNDTRNINNKSSIPISFELWCGVFSPATAGVDLVSIVDPENEDGVPGSAAQRNDAARVGFLPEQATLRMKDITVLSLDYDVHVGTEPSGDSRLGSLDFTDCSGGSLRVELQLRDSKGADAGILKVYLGSNALTNFKSGCNGSESIGLDLVNNPAARVDPSSLLGNLASPCCTTFKNAQRGTIGNLFVRKMALVVDHGDLPATTPANHKVAFFNGNVNNVTVCAEAPCAPSAQTLDTVTDVVRTFDLSTNGVSIIFVMTFDPLAPEAPARVVKVIPSSDIVINGGKFTSSVTVGDIDAHPGGTQYTINLCPSGVEDPAPPLQVGDTWIPRGICISDAAFMSLL